MFLRARHLIFPLLVCALFGVAHAAGTKLSAIASGGTIASGTDQCVAVRSGTTDVLVAVGSCAAENTSTVIPDNGAGALTIGAGQVSNAMLANSSMTLAGHSVALGGTQTFACGDLSNAAASCSTDATNATNISTGSLAYARLPALLANQVLGALTATTPSGQSVPSCSAAGNALNWTAGAGFGCATGYLTGNQSITLSSDVTGSGTTAITTTIANNAVTNAKAAQMAANTEKGNWTGSTANASDNAMPSCSDSGGNHLNYVSGTGITCGTSDTHVGTVTSVATTAPITGGTITSTGTIACATCATTTNGGALSGTAPIAISAGGAVSFDFSQANTWTGLQTFNVAPGIYMTGSSAETDCVNQNSGTSLALNLDNGTNQCVTITGAVAITIATPTHPVKVLVRLTQDGSGHVYSVSGCKWAGGTAITYSTAASKVDIISIMYDGTNFYCMGGAAFS